jgi:hypothetical protein|tara:strand:+ start:1564 stop:1935 length:372 start_codon:yes stop_codon:yes gene_type:complete
LSIEPFICVCFDCGVIFYPDGYPPVSGRCKKCHQAFWIRQRKAYYAERRAQGYIPESRRKAGRKAYNTRLIRMSHKHPQEFQKRLTMLETKAPNRARYIKGRARKESIAVLGYHEPDLGKVIF